MEPKILSLNNCIWECMTTPSNLGANIDTRRLKQKISNLRKQWERGNTPITYTYVFPVNTVGTDAEEALQELQNQYDGLVRVKYFDYNQYNNFIAQVSKLNNFQSAQKFVDYIQDVRRK